MHTHTHTHTVERRSTVLTYHSVPGSTNGIDVNVCSGEALLVHQRPSHTHTVLLCKNNINRAHVPLHKRTPSRISCCSFISASIPSLCATSSCADSSDSALSTSIECVSLCVCTAQRFLDKETVVRRVSPLWIIRDVTIKSRGKEKYRGDVEGGPTVAGGGRELLCGHSGALRSSQLTLT